MRARDSNGAASVEHVGLVLLIALLVLGAIAALVAAPPTEEARRLGSSLDRRIRCPARLPDPCWQDPLTEAYSVPRSREKGMNRSSPFGAEMLPNCTRFAHTSLSLNGR